VDNSKHVFISYKADEFDRAVVVKKHLEANHITCWMAPMSIRGGLSYAEEIPQAIRSCGVFVLILSKKAQESKWVPREVDQAINCEKLIMPYMLENCPLRNDFSFYLTNVQRYEAFRDPEETLDRMTRDIQNVLGITPPVEEETPQMQPPETPEEPKPVKPKPPKKEKKPTDKKKKALPFLLAGALLAVALMVLLLLQPNKRSLGGIDLDVDSYAVNLENVTLSQEDVNKFSQFRNLGVIRLTNCTIEAQDLSPVAIYDLQVLELENCGITDAQFATIDFSAIRNLGSLDISGNSNLTSLQGLEVCGETLQELDISDTGISDFNWLTAFTKLRAFEASRTGLQNMAVLEGAIYLEKISLSGNGITSLDGLKNTSKLSEVDLSYNNLTDVSVLSRSAACLTVLHLEHNSLTDLNCLSETTSLKKVYVDGNALTTLNWLKGNSKLQTLSAAQNAIESISGLGIGEKMSYLNLSQNQLQSVYTGDLAFGDDSYLMVDLSNNQLKTPHLPANCTYKQLVLLGNPDLKLSYVKDLKGWYVYFDFPADVALSTLQELSFNNLCMVGCPLDRQVEIEEGLSSEYLMTAEEALEEIAQKAKDADD